MFRKTNDRPHERCHGPQFRTQHRESFEARGRRGIIPKKLLAASALEFAALSHPRRQPQKLRRRDFADADLPYLDACGKLAPQEQAAAVKLSFPRFRSLTFSDGATGDFVSVEVWLDRFASKASNRAALASVPPPPPSGRKANEHGGGRGGGGDDVTKARLQVERRASAEKRIFEKRSEALRGGYPERELRPPELVWSIDFDPAKAAAAAEKAERRRRAASSSSLSSSVSLMPGAPGKGGGDDEGKAAEVEQGGGEAKLSLAEYVAARAGVGADGVDVAIPDD